MLCHQYDPLRDHLIIASALFIDIASHSAKVLAHLAKLFFSAEVIILIRDLHPLLNFI